MMMMTMMPMLNTSYSCRLLMRSCAVPHTYPQSVFVLLTLNFFFFGGGAGIPFHSPLLPSFPSPLEVGPLVCMDDGVVCKRFFGSMLAMKY